MTPEEQIEQLKSEVEHKKISIKKLKSFIDNIGLICNSETDSETKVQLIKDEVSGVTWGCTDKNASNYDRNATQNDSSCAYIA